MFVGREAVLTQVLQTLCAHRVAYLVGMTGVGKSSLAVHVANSESTQFKYDEGVLWGGLGPQPDTSRVLTEWANALNLAEIPEEQPERRRERVRNAIGDRRMLLVLDDAWTLEAIEKLDLRGPKCGLLVTARDLRVTRGAQPLTVFDIPPLDAVASWELLSQLAQHAADEDQPALRNLSQATGGNALALTLVGNYLASPEYSFLPGTAAPAVTHVANIRSRLALAGKWIGQSRERFSLRDAVLLSATQLDSDLADSGSSANSDASGLKALHALGAFAAQPADFDSNAALAVTQSDTRLLSLLIARNLVQRTAHDRLTVHQVVHDTVADSVTREQRDHHASYYAVLLETSSARSQITQELPQLEHAWANVANPSAWFRFFKGMHQYLQITSNYKTLFGQAASGWPQQLPPLQQCEVLAAVGHCQIHIGRPEEALSNLELSLSEPFVDAPLAYKVRVYNYARALMGSGRASEAHDLYIELQRVAERDGDQVLQAAILNNLGRIEADQHAYPEALHYFIRGRALARRQQMARIYHIATHNIGRTHAEMGDIAIGTPLLREAIEWFDRNNESYYAATGRHHLAVALARSGKASEARQLLNDALRLRAQMGDMPGVRETQSALDCLVDP